MSAAAALAVYVAVTAILFRELLPHLTTHLYSDVGDPLLNTGILAWNARHLPLSADWWNFPSFAPLSGVTSFTEHLLGVYPVTAPIIWATGNAVLAHNAVLLMAFPANGLAAYLLARELTGSRDAAFVGGLAFAFAPYQSVHLSHLQALTAFGMPLALLGLHRFLHSRPHPGAWPILHSRSAISALALFGFGWLLAALSNAYLMVFFPLLVGLWCLWFIRPREWRVVAPVIGTAVLFTLPLVPLLWGYRVRQSAYGFARGIGEMKDFAADVVGVFGISQRELLWRGLLPNSFEEGALFPGVAIALLCLIAVVKNHGRGHEGAATGAAPRFARRLLIAAAGLAAIVMARLWTGPFGWHLGPIPLPPFTPFRVFTVAVVAAVAATLLSARVRRAWRRRDPIVFHVVAIVVLWFVALGPVPEWSASRFRALTYGPYFFLMQLPGFSSIRVPARAWLPATLCLAMLAAYGAARIPPRRRHLIAVVALVIVAEGWFADGVVPAPLPLVAGVVPANAIAIELPMDEGFWNATPQYRAVLGGYRTINGYSGYEPPHFTPLRRQIADLQVDALNPYRLLGDVYVIIHARELPQVAAWVIGHPGARQVYAARDLRVVLLPAMAPPPRRPVPLPLPRPGARPFGTI